MILLETILVVSCTDGQQNTYIRKDVGVTKFVITSMEYVDGTSYTKYYLTKSGNDVIMGESLSFSDTTGKYQVGDVLILGKEFTRYNPVPVSDSIEQDSINKK